MEKDYERYYDLQAKQIAVELVVNLVDQQDLHNGQWLIEHEGELYRVEITKLQDW